MDHSLDTHCARPLPRAIAGCVSAIEQQADAAGWGAPPRLLALLADQPTATSGTLETVPAVPDFRALVIAADGDPMAALHQLAGRASRAWTTTSLAQRAALLGQSIVGLVFVCECWTVTADRHDPATPNEHNPHRVETRTVAAVDTAGQCYLAHRRRGHQPETTCTRAKARCRRRCPRCWPRSAAQPHPP